MRITSLLLAASFVAVLLYWFHFRHQDDGAAVAATATVETPALPVQPETTVLADASDAVPVMVLESTARATASELVVRGRTEAARNVQVAAQTAGSVISQPLRRGARVTKGQPLCELDPGIRAAELAEAEAALAEAAAEANASTRLNQKGFAAETTLKTRIAQMEAAEARLDRVKWDIDQLVIRAPFNGVLESDTAEFGTYLTMGGICANVIDLSSVKVAGFVSEQEIDLLSVGQETSARLINGIEATGTIAFLSRMADAQTRTFAVEVSLPNPEGRIRDGMTAELRIALPARKGHLVPQSALTLDDAGRMGVRVDEDGIARFKPVQILADELGGIWIGGLNDTARIIVVGQEFVRDGRSIVPSATDLATLRANRQQ
ncbi:MAG: efflux RND transporter periplasmic adaptor subunit [Pseudomonadota bacterium]